MDNGRGGWKFVAAECDVDRLGQTKIPRMLPVELSTTWLTEMTQYIENSRRA